MNVDRIRCVKSQKYNESRVKVPASTEVRPMVCESFLTQSLGSYRYCH